MAKKEKSNGGSTDYYKVPVEATELQDLIEYREMSFSLGNIFKAAWRIGKKANQSKADDLRKIIWYASRMLAEETGEFYEVTKTTKKAFHKKQSSRRKS